MTSRASRRQLHSPERVQIAWAGADPEVPRGSEEALGSAPVESFFSDGFSAHMARRHRFAHFVAFSNIITTLALAPAATSHAGQRPEGALASGRMSKVSASGTSWNSEAIRATFDGLNLDDSGHVVFYYVLQNTTATEYRLADGSTVEVLMRQRRIDGRHHLSDRDVKVGYPILVPAKQRQIVTLKSLLWTCPLREPKDLNPTAKEEERFSSQLRAFVDRRSPELAGFVLLDTTRGYEIDLPKGW